MARAGAVCSVLDRHPVDIPCLQEVHFYDDEPDGQLLEELSGAGLGHFVGSPLSKSHLDRSAGLGIGIASATPLSPPVMFQLSNPGLRASVRGEQWVLHDKGLLGCAVQTPDGRWSRNKWQFLLDDLVTTSFGLPLDEIALSWSPVCSGARSVPTFSDHHLAIVDVRL